MGYFCGHQWFCFLGNNEQAFKMARKNIEDKFIFIGVLEELELSLKLFEKSMPGCTVWKNGKKTGKNSKKNKSFLGFQVKKTKKRHFTF